MSGLLQAAKAVIDYEKDHSYNFADRVAALRAAVERAKKQDAVGFDDWWSANADSEMAEVAIHKWDECWTAAQQAERERLWNGVIIAVERLKTKDTEGLLSDFTDRILEVADNECKEIKTATQQAERERIKGIIREVTGGFGNCDRLMEKIDATTE